ncbi:hypothetical protein RRG08_046755 [Elysia crispata]|uniref:Uncharacterized protein n=1 Tax=Elysia crispata TaxID=231223 RepID=A0AAE0ZVH9_9GAST|nr:hypothetical protein RRG08_046755 [Elysia crispata]
MLSKDQARQADMWSEQPETREQLCVLFTLVFATRYGSQGQYTLQSLVPASYGDKTSPRDFPGARYTRAGESGQTYRHWLLIYLILVSYAIET